MVLVNAAATSDEIFEGALGNFHPRVFKPLGRFFDAMALANAECRMVTGMHDVRLNGPQIIAAAARVSATDMSEESIEKFGIFGGVLIPSRRFDFTTHSGNVLSGWLADSVGDDEAAAMGAYIGSAAAAVMKMTTIETRSGKKKPAYELVRLAPPPDVYEQAVVRVYQS